MLFRSDNDGLIALDQALKMQYITEPMEMLTKHIESILDKKTWHRVADITGGMDMITRITAEGFSMEHMEESEYSVLEEILVRLVDKKEEKLQDREQRHETRTTNRAMYLPQVTLLHEVTKDGKKRRWRFETDLISTGLLPRMLESMGEKTEGQPLSLRIVNNMPLIVNERGEVTIQDMIPEIGRAHV